MAKLSSEVIVMRLAKQVFTEEEYQRFMALAELREHSNPQIRAAANLELLKMSERLQALLDARHSHLHAV
ncbi:hypothetical protein [Alicyclobacillus macrosporangiidus]|uniref:Uncharacterized protein n=1 Tax=Alicyclobacillus macrosporangiidus TaxID=392015 RepID=A0A1I7IF30_9BACL|nr:hypothetical protein [Alicyclobacillus macrosporangiidus]SFU71549.1 hypothetical protein SAMN05421543_106184 [Alicyclobacillus macrosporangiidus]